LDENGRANPTMARTAFSASSPPAGRRGKRRGGSQLKSKAPSPGYATPEAKGKLWRPAARKKVAAGGGDRVLGLTNKKRLQALADDPFGVRDKKPGNTQFALRVPRRQRPNKKKKQHKKAAGTSDTVNISKSATDKLAPATAREAAPRLLLGLRGGDSLDDELRRFAAFVALSPRERQVRARVFRDLRAVIRAAFADVTVALYGSSSSGLDTFRSDLDVSVGNLSLAALERASGAEFFASVVVPGDSDDDLDDSNEPQGESDDSDGGNQGQDDASDASFSLNLSLPSSFSLNLSVPTTNSTMASSSSSSSLLFQSKRMAGISLPAPIVPSSAGRNKSTWNPTRRRQKLRELRALQLLLKTQRPHLRVKCLPKAKVPILMVEDPETHVEVDIGINREVFAHSEHGRSTSLAVKLQGALGQPFTELVSFLKEFLHQFELDKPFTGGLGSFRLYVMVASVFPSSPKQKAAKRNREAPPSASSLPAPLRSSDLLLRFLEVFGNCKRAKYLHANTQLSLAIDPSCVVDFTGVFRLDECVEMFAMAYDILSGSRSLASIIYEDRLARDRETKWRQAVDTEKENAGADSA